MDAPVPTLGHHVLVELFGCDPLRTDDVVAVRGCLLAAVRAIGATPVGEVFHRFSPQGVSGVVLIAESHLSCHTWPEAGYVAIDIYTCGDLDAHAAVARLCATFDAQTWLVEDVLRGLVALAPASPVERRRALYDRRQIHLPGARPAHERPVSGGRRPLFAANGIVDVTDLVSPETFFSVREEVIGRLRSGNAGDSTLVRSLYASRALLDPLEAITGEPLYACPEPDGALLVTEQHQRGDTDGWHWGDCRYAMLWILDAPPLASGGSLQCVPDTSWNREDPRILDWLTERPIDTYGILAGQSWLIKTDTTLHRTTPLAQDVTRILLHMTWASADELRGFRAPRDRRPRGGTAR